MALEIAEYSVNWETKEEQRTVLRVIQPGDTEVVFNLGAVTGIYEEVVAAAGEQDSWFFRGGGGTVHLSDPREVPFVVEPPARNVMQLRGEVFFYGSTDRVVSIRRVSGNTQEGGDTEEEAYVRSLVHVNTPPTVDEYGVDTAEMRRLLDETPGVRE